MEGKEEASERVLNEIKASQLSHTEFKAMVIRKFTELTENYQKLQGNYNDINMKKEIETLKQGPGGNEEYNFGTEEHSRRNQKQA